MSNDDCPLAGSDMNDYYRMTGALFLSSSRFVSLQLRVS